MRLIPIFFLLILFIQCKKSPYTFKDISSYNIATEGLSAGEQVKVIYNSGAPDNHMESNYYLQMIVVSQSTNDTFNLLTTVNSNVTKEDSLRYYVEPDNPANKILENMDQLTNGMNIHELEGKKIEKVVVNDATKSATDNNYPTLIGLLANEIKKMDE